MPAIAVVWRGSEGRGQRVRKSTGAAALSPHRLLSLLYVSIPSLLKHHFLSTPSLAVHLSSIFSAVIHTPFFFSLPSSHLLHPPLIALCNTGGEHGYSVRVTLTSVTPCSTCDLLLSVLRSPLNPYNILRCLLSSPPLPFVPFGILFLLCLLSPALYPFLCVPLYLLCVLLNWTCLFSQVVRVCWPHTSYHFLGVE
jgi:hypothetical protein